MWLSSSTISHSACTRCSASIARSIADNDLGGHRFGCGLPVDKPASLARVRQDSRFQKIRPGPGTQTDASTSERARMPKETKKNPGSGERPSRGPPKSQGGQGFENLGAPSIGAIGERFSLLV